MQKCLGVDVGQERVGVSVSDDGGTVAFPLAVLQRRECVAQLLTLIAERDIAVVVFGESLDLDGEENPIMTEVRDIADAVREQVAVVFESEQFSTQAASRLGKGSDAEAAAIILQSYLDRQNRGKKEDIINFD
ncbi:MAG: RuvX/YqgF family protein [Candidatus Kaiserbacteria bacterium]|nr:RuvX/YqgF family protein [Candidatus Kaiserbacteria bacterium]